MMCGGKQAMWRVAGAAALMAAGLSPSAAEVITFPVGTPVAVDFGSLTYSVRSGPFIFWRFGSLYINTSTTGGLHAGGLRVQPIDASEFLEILRFNAGGAPFNFKAMSVIELNTTSGLQLIVTGRDHATQQLVEVELPFDRDTQTYDLFELAEAESPGFGNVDYVAIQIESPFVDPVFAPYVIDWIDLEISPACRVDIDGDGLVTFDDLNALLAHWGQSGGVREDVNGSGVVDFDDLNLLLASWGEACG
ncbi:MAG: hypothetical protein KDA21_10360 [Phycisphaerales bacterium]|nr:hypothetical protein [Phycisphaerales bacterium]